jgi:phosphoribosylglycinamide formyltransferase-1
MLRIVILISGSHGRGSTLVNLASACRDGRVCDAEVVGVIGAVGGSPAIERAKSLDLPVSIITPNKEDYGGRLLARLEKFAPDLICLAGYMRKLPGEVLERYRNQVVNIHPALLPSFGGQGMYGSNVHQAVYDYGVKVSGCTVHFIDASYDTGPIILQKIVALNSSDTPEDIAAKVLVAEHAAYPEAVNLIAQGKVRIDGRRVVVSPHSAPPEA